MKNNLFTFLSIVLLFFVYIKMDAQSGTWTWKHGNQGTGLNGNYGVKGMPADSNLPVGRYQCAYWLDAQGNFWMFGGVTFQTNSVSVQNDLWKFNPITNQWTWINGPKLETDKDGEFGIKGVPSALNYPSARGYGLNCWADTAGQLWLYGGFGRDRFGDLKNLNDLWRYTIATNQWTWISGNDTGGQPPVIGTPLVFADSVTPGSLQEIKSSWVDNNNHFYIFGGKSNFFSGYETSNSMWEYNPNINQWRWRKGNDAVNLTGRYGQKGIEDTANYPPARCSYTKWQDPFGNFYIFGGGRFLNNINLNDTWRYNTTTNAWTWINGPDTVNQPGVYGPFCILDSTLYPHPRIENQASQNNVCQTAFWNFGGFNLTEQKCYNDVWLFSSLQQKWVNMHGSDTTGAIGNYGIKGVANTINEIPGKCGVAIWSDKNNKLWVFGGINENQTDVKNDLWQFVPDSNCFFATFQLPPLQFNKTKKCIDDTTIISNLDTNWVMQIYPNANAFFSINNSRLFLTPSITTSYTFVAVDKRIADCVTPDTVTFTIEVDTFVTTIFNVNNFTVCPNVQQTIIADTQLQYTWLPINALLPNADTSAWLSNIFANTNITIIAKYKNVCSYADTTNITGTVLQPAYPIINISNQKICKGDSIQITVSQDYTFGILPITTDVTINMDTTLVVIKPTTNTVYTITATNNASVCAATTILLLPVIISKADTLALGPFKNDTICVGQRVVITGPLFANWIIAPSKDVQNNAGNVVFTPTQTTTYTITSVATNLCQISTSATITIVVEPNPVASFTINPLILIQPKDSIFLDNTSTNSVSNQWYLIPNKFIDTTTDLLYTLKNTGQYCFRLIATNKLGCTDTAENCLMLLSDTNSVLLIPNVFSPNNDLNNDIFIIKHKNISLVQFDIYNRWGQKVFGTTDINKGWDGYFKGKLCDMETYYYTITYTEYSGVQKTLNGDVLLLK
jgi:gliding motility-associated-like protein